MLTIRPLFWYLLFTSLSLALIILFFHEALLSHWNSLILTIQSEQRHYHKLMVAALRDWQSSDTVSFALPLICFLYGLFHAIGPGHGKFIITTFLYTQESRLFQGLTLSLLSSLVQGLTAILLVEALVGLLGYSFRFARGAANDLELTSFAIIMILGLFLIITRGFRLFRATSSSHDHGSCHACGHNHVPSLPEGNLSIKSSLLLIASIGMRPCSGAIIVLLAATAMGEKFAGILGVLAMSLGTGVSIMAMALLSVYARRASLAFAKHQPGSHVLLSWLGEALGLIGGLVLLLLGFVLFYAGLSAPAIDPLSG